MAGHRRILIVAYSGQGHINPALRFASRLINMGADVTFCTSLSVVQRIRQLTTPPGLTFAPFSDGHDNGKQPTTTLLQFVSDFETNGARAVAETISRSTTVGCQPYDCLVYTTVIPWAARVAYAHGIKSALLWCQSATVLDIYYYYSNEYQSLISSNNDNPTFPINLPGLPPLTIGDLPSFLLASNPKEHDFLVPILKDHIEVLKISPTILVNTFNELEFESINAVDELKFIPIGPLIPSEFSDGDFFEKTEEDYIQWLNTKPKSSVVYVAFGTIAGFSKDQQDEIASGLAESGRPFLWVIRDNEQAERLRTRDDLRKQGMVVGWCSQTVVLSHQAIGCFLMHGGWNSTVESLVAGVPTVVFPQWSDQPNDGKMIEDVWKTGVRVRRREGDGVMEGKETVRCVERVMGNEEMKRNADKWSQLAREAVSHGGSSTINLQTFLDNL